MRPGKILDRLSWPVVPAKLTPARDQQSLCHGLILNPTHGSAPAGMLRPCSCSPWWKLPWEPWLSWVFFTPGQPGRVYQGDRSRETNTIAGFRYIWVQERGDGRHGSPVSANSHSLVDRLTPIAFSLTPGHAWHSSVASGTGGNWAFFVITILQHFMAVSITCCGKAWIFYCMNVGVFISPVSSFLKPVIHFHDSVL